MQTRTKRNKKEREVAAASALTLTLTLTLTLVVLMLLLLSSVSGASGVRHQRYSEANASDEGIHSFFTDVLGDAGTCMAKFINESHDADKFASSLESELKVTEEESRLYATKGIESNVSRVLTPFSPLSGGVKKITLYQTVFLTNYAILKNESDYEAYLRARTAVVNMRTGADEINASLDEIEHIELRNETSKILFNVSEQREKLKDVYALIDRYEQLLEEYEFEAPAFEEYLLVVVVSDEHPFLYEEIRIHVYTKNVTALSLFIGNVTHELKNQTGEQTKKHRFDVPGEHEIYAEGVTTGEGENITSNIVKVYVDKIPTFVSLSSKYAAFVNERVKITGLLVDYYNEPLDGANVTVKIGGEEAELTTDRGGYFRFYGTKSSEGVLNVSAIYPGNDTYKSSRANISIFFSRLPVSLHIEANKTHINVNETVNFAGSVYGIDSNYSVSLIIFVNATRVKTLTAAKDFNFSLFFSHPGTYEVYATFPGDSLFKPAKSNVIKITVTEKVEVVGEKKVEGIITKIAGIIWLITNPRSYLFGIDAGGLEEDLNKGIIPEELKREFESKGFSLSDFAAITKEKENEWEITDKEKFIVMKGDGKLSIYREYNIFFYLLLILVAIVSFFAGLHARTLKRKLHALGEKLHIPAGFSFTRIHSQTSKGKMNALISKLRVFREKILAPIASIFAGLHARTLKRKLHALGERFHIPPAFSFSRLHSLTSKGKIKALISKLHVFREKILAPIASIFAGLHARTLKRKLHALGERLHIPPAFSFSRLHSLTSKGKIKALISKLHIFKEKILTPIGSLFASLYGRTLKGKMHALRSKFHAFKEKTLAPIASIFAVIYARAFKGKFYAFSKSKNKLRALLEKKRAELKNTAAKNLEIDVVEVEKEEEQYEEVSEVNILEGVDFEDAYKLLFDTIVAKHRLKKSFTPRELSEKLKEEAFAEKLEKVTELYEKRVFGNVELSDEEGETYFRWIKDILGAC